jgi:uncharacterized glyoxalase superfamily protein PhnB
MTTNSPLHNDTGKRAESESFNASAFSISLTVNDLATSLAWYHDVLGFTIDRKMEREGILRSVVLTAGNARISINQDDGAKGWDRIKRLGFSLNLITEHDIDKTANRIKERGGVLDTEPADMPWGVRLFRLKDPDGYKLSISSPRPA